MDMSTSNINTKTTDINPNMSLTALDINILNSPTKK